MSRPQCCRTIDGLPAREYFKPRGVPLTRLEEVILTIDEYEALKLADYRQLYQEHAAEHMHVSRQTFGRIILSAHSKIADVLIHGKALKIEGGEIILKNRKRCRCPRCGESVKKTKRNIDHENSLTITE